MKINRITVIFFAVILIIGITAQHLSAQLLPFNRFPPVYGFGIAGGITTSSYSGDSAGYTGVSMPYGGLFLNVKFTPEINVCADLHYIVKGVNRDSPYQRYRYSYFSTELMAGYTLAGFIQLNAGYRYGFENSAKMIVLNGNNPSGVERSNVSGFGNYGQFIVGSTIYFSNAAALVLRYGIPGPGIPMTHFQAGIRMNLDQWGPSRRMTEEASKRRVAGINAQMLRDGLLLVRLSSMRSSIKALQENGRMSEAEKLRVKIHSENLNLINAFDKYTFSKVLFFYDYNSDLVREGRLDTILLNNNLEHVQPGKSTGHIFTAHLGDYTSPEKSYHIRRDPQYLKENRIAPDSSAAYITYSHQATRIGGIVLMDQQFQPLDRPFPSYTPVLSQRIMNQQTRLERAVMRLNEALLKLYF